MQLLQETPELHENPTLHPFRSQFKRHTEFSMIDIEQRIVNNTVEFSKYGDILMYSYLYSDYLLVDSTFTWSSYISTIDVYIGEQLVNSYDIDYIVNIYPKFIVDTYAHSNYSKSSFFLPIPIPRIPMCALRYANVKLVVNFIKSLPNYKCFSVYSLLSDTDKGFLISNTHDIIIHQTQSKSINTDGSILLNHPIKFIYSDNIKPDTYVLNGSIFDIPNTQIYYTSQFFTQNDTVNIINIKTPVEIPNSVTSTVVKKLIYIFPENGNYYDIFNSDTQTFTRVTINQTLNFLYSVYDSLGYVLAIGEQTICIINTSTGTNVICNFTTPLYGPFYATIINGTVYAFGKKVFNSCLLNGTSTNNGKVYNNTETNFAYATSSGTLIIFYTTDGKFKTNAFDVTNINTPVSIFNIPYITSTTQFKNVSSSISVNSLIYYTPMSPTDNLIVAFNDEIIQNINIGYGISSGLYDGVNFIYLCPIGKVSLIVKLNIVSVLGLALFFCLKSNSQNPSGSLNFSQIESLSFPGIYSGTLNAVNYNILRIENGFGSILYAS